MLKEDCLDTTLSHVTDLLTCQNLWTASNAALVLARYLILCEDKLAHTKYLYNLLKQMSECSYLGKKIIWGLKHVFETFWGGGVCAIFTYLKRLKYRI